MPPHVIRLYDSDLWERVRRRAIEDGLHTSAVVSRAVRQYLDGAVAGTAVATDRAGRALTDPPSVLRGTDRGRAAGGGRVAGKVRGGWKRPDV